MNYQAHYDRLIERARLRPKPAVYCENHHIVPKCLGGSDEDINLVMLTAPEHYVAHQLLVKLNPTHYGISYAATRMTEFNDRLIRSNKLYGWLRVRYVTLLSAFQKERFKDKRNHPCYGKYGKDHPAYGRVVSDEERLATSKRARGQLISEESRKKLSIALLKAFSTQEYKDKVSAIRKEAFKGEKNPAYGTKMINNGVIRKRIPSGSPLPDGWVWGVKLTLGE